MVSSRIALHDRAKTACAGFALDGLAGDHRQSLVLEGEVHVLHLEEALILLYQRVFRLLQNLLQRVLIEILKGGENRQAADEFRDKPELQKVLGLDSAEDLACPAIVRRASRRRRSRSTCPCRGWR